MTTKPIHCRLHKIGKTSITHAFINDFFVLPPQKFFIRKKIRLLFGDHPYFACRQVK